MSPTSSANHDPALTNAAPAAGAPPPSQVPVGIPANLSATDIASMQNMQFSNLDQNQIMTLLRSLPGVFNKSLSPLSQLTEHGSLKEDAAQTLSNLAQAPFSQQGLPVHYPSGAPSGLPGINDPGPSSHPRGPPNLGQLSAVALQAAPASQGQQQGNSEQIAQSNNGAAQVGMDSSGSSPPASGTSATNATGTTGGRRGRGPAMGSDEWTRQRKDNHKEVERRRRGNINEGINELGRIVPNGSGEKAKGAILSRAVQYIHHLKENEARNIEKWTLEKLLMDQAMGDLQAQLEEVKRLWEEERAARQRLENELEGLRGRQGSTNGAKEEGASGTKRRSDAEADGSSNAATGEMQDGERDGKRQRTE